MSLLPCLQNPTTMMRIGLLSMIAGALSLRLNAWLHVGADLADGLSGFFYGIAIASLLLSVRARCRR
jgi:uncharacterized membrane protein YvlD (DUF360 family)